MNIYTAIGLGITIAGFIGGIITVVAKLAVKTGQIMEKLQDDITDFCLRDFST